MRDAFAVLFFVSVGMLFDPRSLAESPLVIASVLGVVIIVKPLAAVLTVRALGKPMSMAIPIGAAFSQVGEFSFILGTLARSLGLINDAGWNALVAASILSIALNPSIYGWARHLSRNRTEEAPIPANSVACSDTVTWLAPFPRPLKCWQHTEG
jgi:CPA2 family monovalent cation:H+ antiporter-2